MPPACRVLISPPSTHAAFQHSRRCSRQSWTPDHIESGRPHHATLPAMPSMLIYNVYRTHRMVVATRRHHGAIHSRWHGRTLVIAADIDILAPRDDGTCSFIYAQFAMPCREPCSSCYQLGKFLLLPCILYRRPRFSRLNISIAACCRYRLSISRQSSTSASLYHAIFSHTASFLAVATARRRQRRLLPISPAAGAHRRRSAAASLRSRHFSFTLRLSISASASPAGHISLYRNTRVRRLGRRC